MKQIFLSITNCSYALGTHPLNNTMNVQIDSIRTIGVGLGGAITLKD